MPCSPARLSNSPKSWLMKWTTSAGDLVLANFVKPQRSDCVMVAWRYWCDCFGFWSTSFTTRGGMSVSRIPFVRSDVFCTAIIVRYSLRLNCSSLRPTMTCNKTMIVKNKSPLIEYMLSQSAQGSGIREGEICRMTWYRSGAETTATVSGMRTNCVENRKGCGLTQRKTKSTKFSVRSWSMGTRNFWAKCIRFSKFLLLLRKRYS
mmetsp:Transcript_136389/g.272034  ORF Transcript_136389/g.272034 Transcript_136389/m.272034 type:complete len:205 (+) Transcript_136389:639-1253(+)